MSISCNSDMGAVAIRDRSYLAGSGSPDVPKTIPRASSEHLLMIEGGQAGGAVEDIAMFCREIINSSLYERGAILFEGLRLCDREDFNSFVEHLGYKPFSYSGGIAVRNHEPGLVLMASNEDSRITMAPHNEMAYLSKFPRKIFFFCAQEGLQGGEVPISDIRKSVMRIPADILDKFRTLGVRYYRNLPRENTSSEIGWPETFETTDKRVVESIMKSKGFDYRWGDRDRLSYSYVNPAFVQHCDTGEELWFNQVTELHCSYWRNHPLYPSDLPEDAYPATTAYGDGTPIPESLITFLRAVLWEPALAVKMKRGDVLALDNLVIQHGRIGFSPR
ncbi:TauD/TfdA family dioxygenase [Pseudomonas sp. GCEP-101]|uniref:TauD/TfdA family dioxygenase n=1 Tax=Pseudomonas sp. GCEP-101 TaxID=2974552 RepID=UPI00223AA5EA|nr:TauD/TfdA family dioxygenase [Pseudomonas sp. GCEP-101]